MLFFISLIMVFVSSYMTGCIAAPKNKDNKLYGPAPFLYILLTMFAQVVLTFEVLSLFKAINEVNVLLINVVFLIMETCISTVNKTESRRNMESFKA